MVVVVFFFFYGESQFFFIFVYSGYNFCLAAQNPDHLRFFLLLLYEKTEFWVIGRKNKSAFYALLSFISVLNISLHFTGTQATGAGGNSFGGAVYNCPYFLQVGFPGSFGANMGVTDRHPTFNTFAANFAFCHLLHLLLSSD